MIRSPTQVVMDSMIFRPTRRSRNKPKPIPSADQVTTLNYTAMLTDVRWLRTKARHK
ncbi:NinE family protein [Pectobacterium polaris]|uniref:NinE family protein n=1 Tax=Pectobacterium polaris TaxID=2042057 RepID=UPI0032F01AB0